ncbi:PadR family transcriptional regulator [Altericista sp. CCNU0014]|uniref:PadR family transcriptional regulator n=1 Tax=Altericista sp. CCNU0014 TaxID=3082949 RepID=UPI00384FD5CF
MKFQDIYHFFQEPPPIYLSKEVAVCYILSVLLRYGDSYGTALIQRIEQDSPLYRLSDTVLYSALKFLEDEKVVDGYWQKVEGRGRPRRMYQIKASKLELAKQLERLWHDYIAQSDMSNQRQSG